MSSTPTSPEPTDPAPQSQPEDDPAAPSPSPQHAIAFDRLARTVRRTIALARKLSEPDKEPPGPKLRPETCYAEGWDERRLSARQRSTDCADADAQHAEPCERPEEPDDDLPEGNDEDLDEQDIAYLMASIGNDLNRAALPDPELWKRRTPQGRQQGVSGDRCPRAAEPCHPEPARSHAGSHDPVATPPAPPGTGPPDP